VMAELPRPKLVIIGEPSDMQVVNAHKGIRAFRTTVTGREAHSSHTDKGVNAVMVAAELITYLETIAEDMRRRGDPSDRFDPPYTTVQSSVIHGGTALNILARECTFHWEYRCLPGTDEEEIFERFNHHAREEVLPRLKRVASEADIVTVPGSRVPPLKAVSDCAAEALARQLTGRNSSEAVSYGTEAGLFQESGIPAVVCGPGSIAQAHKAEEYLDLDQLNACAGFLRRVAHWAMQSPVGTMNELPPERVENIGLDHIYLTVLHLERSEKFYDAVLGLMDFRKSDFRIGDEPHRHYFNKSLQISIRPARTATQY